MCRSGRARRPAVPRVCAQGAYVGDWHGLRRRNFKKSRFALETDGRMWYDFRVSYKGSMVL